jgi:hypothetical protein
LWIVEHFILIMAINNFSGDILQGASGRLQEGFYKRLTKPRSSMH